MSFNLVHTERLCSSSGAAVGSGRGGVELAAGAGGAQGQDTRGQAATGERGQSSLTTVTCIYKYTFITEIYIIIIHNTNNWRAGNALSSRTGFPK